MAVAIPAGPRILAVGNAPATQTGAGGQWVNAWSLNGLTAVHKSDASNAAEAWTAVKYTDALSTILTGGDIYRGDLGVSGQNSATSSTKQEIDGKEALRFNMTEAAQALTLNLSSFYAGDDGSGYAEGARIRLYSATGQLVGESFVRADGSSGNQLVQINSAQVFNSIEISAGARKADGSFSYGGYYNADGSFGTDAYTSGAKHGSDVLVHSLSVTLARPAAQADHYTLDEDAAATMYGSVLANDTDPNAAPLSALLDAGPSHGTLILNSNGSFTYTPDADYFGTDTFSYRASNGKDASDSTVVSLVVNAINDAPVAANDLAATNEDAAIAGNLLGNDSDKEGNPLTVTTTGTFTTTLGATLVLDANGNYSYDPTKSSVLQAMSGGASRVDTFNYTISDGHGGTSTAQLRVTVEGRDEASGSNILPNTADGTELTYYLRYTQDNKVSSWMKLDGFNMGVQSEADVLKGGGLAIGKATPGDFLLELGSGKALADFTSALFGGKKIANIEIEAYAGSSLKSPALVQEFRFTDAFVTSSTSSSGDGGATSNTLSFAYSTLDENVSPLDSKGKSSTPHDASWNVEDANGTITGNAVIDGGADATINRLEQLVSADTPLDYYVHVDGMTGWVPLNSFAIGHDADSTYLKGGLSVGKAEADDLTMGLGLNQVLTTLFNNELLGTRTNVQVEAYARVGDKTVLVDEYFFNQAMMSGVDMGTDANNTVSLTYGAYSRAHLAYDQTGKLDTQNSTKVGHDFVANTTTTIPGAVAEALTGRIPGISADSDLTYYMRYNDGSASKWVLIDGFSLGYDSETSILKGGGTAAGKASPDNFTLQLGTGKALTDFLGHLVTGKGIASVEIEAYNNSSKATQLVQEFKFTGALVTSVQTATGAEGATQNTLEFAYKSVNESFTPLDATGKPLAAQEVAWNVVTASTTLPGDGAIDPGADANIKSLAPQVGSTEELEYYIHIDGVDGWVALSSFKLGYTAESSYLGGAGGVGKGAASEITVDMGLSQVLSTLLNNEISGTATPTIQIEAYTRQANGTRALVDEYFFKKVLTSGVTSNSDAGNTLNLAYDAFSHSHIVYDAKGKANSTESSSVSYDFAEGNEHGTIPNPVADVASNTTLMPSTAPGTDLTYYMRYTENGVSKWVELDGFSMSVDAAVSSVGGQGVMAGKATPGAFTMELGTGKALTDFTQAMFKGGIIDNVEIEAYHGIGISGKAQVAQEFRFTDVLVTSAHTDAGADGATLNTISFAYKSINETLSPLDKAGKPVSTEPISWTVPTGSTTLPPNGAVNAGADADLKRLAPTVSSSAELDYYVHVDGVEGWVPLSSFSASFTADSSYLKGSGAAVAKPTASDVTLGLGLSQVLTTLLNNEIAGNTTTIQIEAYLPGGGSGKPQLVDEYFFKLGVVTGVDSTTNASNEVSLLYSAFTHAHLAYDTSGKFNANESSSVGYDFGEAHIIASVPAAVADVFH